MPQLNEAVKGTRMKRLNIISLRMVKEGSLSYQTNRIRCPQDAFELAQAFIGDEDREHCILLCLDTKNKVTTIQTIAIGSLNAAIVHPREVFKAAILSNSASIIIAHNHPSGDTTASDEDMEIGKRIKIVGELIGIELLDFVIVSTTQHSSMKEKGII
ncbi:RadC family protein [Brevibacillus sp. B_LB10_24]|uniref:JAB domain-containing protein n=1 Tax=Brevibacillus sp. B_LB10_24 TaxID=3380645 RepID=UPI0038BC5D06